MQNKKPTEKSGFISKLNPMPDPADTTISTLEYETNMKAYTIVEKLAEIEHNQWIFWSSNILRDLDEQISLIVSLSQTLELEQGDVFKKSPHYRQVRKLIDKHNERDKRWESLRCSYKQLPDEEKERNRIWAKKAYDAIK